MKSKFLSLIPSLAAIKKLRRKDFRMNRAIVIFLLIIVTSIPLFAKAVEGHNTPEQEKDFIIALLQEKEYFRAITEAKKFIFFRPNSPYVEEIKLLIADAYALGGDETKAYALYQKFIHTYRDSILLPIAIFKMGRLLADNRNYEKAKQYFEQAATHPKSSKMLVRKAKTWLILSCIITGTKIPTYDRLPRQKMIDDYIEDYKKLDFKSPQKAGILSAIVPGMGQLYIGRNRDALAAFTLNAVFIWGIIESFSEDHVSAGVALSIFEIGWYGGNVYSAINGAHKHNRQLNDSFKNHFSIGLNINVAEYDKNTSAMLVFNYSF